MTRSLGAVDMPVVPRSVRLFVAAVAIAVVTACATLPTEVEKTSSSPTANFSLAGRISVRNGQQVEIAQVRWQRDSAAEEILLMSPLGSIVARLSRQAGEPAQLWTAQESKSAVSLDALAQDALGTAIPISALGWWLQGHAGDGRTRQLSNTFMHEGWEVTLEKFEVMSGQEVARRVNAMRGDIVIRLFVDEWQPRP